MKATATTSIKTLLASFEISYLIDKNKEPRHWRDIAATSSHKNV
jgi:hypothetical protein